MKVCLAQQQQLSQSMIDRQWQAAPSAQGNVQYVQSTVNLGQPAVLTNPVQYETAFVTQQLSQSLIDRQQQVPSNAQGNVQYVQSTVNLRQPAVSDNISDTISIPTLPYSSANFESGLPSQNLREQSTRLKTLASDMPKRPSSSSSGSHETQPNTTRSTEGYCSKYPLVQSRQAGDQNMTYPTSGNNDLNSSYLPQNVTVRRSDRLMSNTQTESQHDTSQMGDTTLSRYVADIQSACQCTGSDTNPDCRVHAGSDEYYRAWAADIIYLYNRHRRTVGSLQSAPLNTNGELNIPPSAHTSAHSTPAASRLSGVANHLERSPDISNIATADGETSFTSQTRNTMVKTVDTQSQTGRHNRSGYYNLFEDSKTEYDAMYSNQGTNKSSQVNKEIFRNSASQGTVSSKSVQGPLQERPPVDFKQFIREKREAARKKWHGIKLGLDNLNINTKQFMKTLDLQKPNASTNTGARPKTQTPKRNVPINKSLPPKVPLHYPPDSKHVSPTSLQSTSSGVCFKRPTPNFTGANNKALGMSGSQAAHPLNKTIEGARNKQEPPISTTQAKFRHLTPSCVPKAAQIQHRHTTNTHPAASLKLDVQKHQFQRQQEPPQPVMRVYNRQPTARCRDTQQQTTPIPMKQVPLPQSQQTRVMGDQLKARYTHAQQQTTPVPIIQRRAPLPVLQDKSVGDQRIATYTDTQQQTTPAPIKQEHGSFTPVNSATYDEYQAQLLNQLYIMEDRCRALINERDSMAQDVDRLASTNKGQVDAIHNLQAQHQDLKLMCQQLQYQQVSQPVAQPPVQVMPPPPPPPPQQMNVLSDNRTEMFYHQSIS